MNAANQFWKDLGTTLGLPSKSLTSLEIFTVLFILYILYFVFSTGILYLSFAFVEKKISGAQAAAAIIIRDIIFLPLSFLAFGLGYLFAFPIWIGLLKYRFKVEWGRAALIALVAALLPAALTIIVLIYFFATIIFLAMFLG